MASQHLPYGRQAIDDSDIDAVTRAMRGTLLTTGPVVAEFEQALAKRLDTAHVVACSSGTAALHLAALSLDLTEEDDVIVPSTTFVATANCARYVGAEVRFADVDPRTGLMTPETLEEALARPSQRRARATIPVHLTGQTVDLPGIATISQERGLDVIEDASHALGSRYATLEGEVAVGAGQHSKMACFSFHPVKTITTTEGGCLATRDPSVAQRARRLRSHGIDRELEAPFDAKMAFDSTGAANAWYYEMSELGFNYRISDVQCALGISQLARLDQFAARRDHLVSRYRNLLESLAPTVSPVATAPGKPVLHLFVVLIDFDAIRIERSAFMRQLAERGIGTQVHYIPVHKQPYYRRRYGELSLPGVESFYRQCLSLPLFPDMLDEDVDRTVAAIEDCLRRG